MVETQSQSIAQIADKDTADVAEKVLDPADAAVRIWKNTESYRNLTRPWWKPAKKFPRPAFRLEQRLLGETPASKRITTKQFGLFLSETWKVEKKARTLERRKAAEKAALLARSLSMYPYRPDLSGDETGLGLAKPTMVEVGKNRFPVKVWPPENEILRSVTASKVRGEKPERVHLNVRAEKALKTIIYFVTDPLNNGFTVIKLNSESAWLALKEQFSDQNATKAPQAKLNRVSSFEIPENETYLSRRIRLGESFRE